MEQDCQNVRLELKEWEKSFAAANGGKKAGREDIKQHPDIANKYKLYNKLRAGGTSVAEQISAPSQEVSPKKRRARKAPPASAQTPPKRLKHLQPFQDAVKDPEKALNSPEVTPIIHRKSIGPTPQKDGRVLGLFDLLTPSSSFRTPSKRQSLAPLHSNIIGTPSRAGTKNGDDNQRAKSNSLSNEKQYRSPPSASKRACSSSLLTPLTRRIVDVSKTPDAANSVSKLRFDDTPAFLRRDSQRFSQSQNINGAEDGSKGDTFSWSPVAVRTMRPKPAGKGLSALVKGLREMEEAKLDEELDLLREMEGGSVDAPKICVEDSQVVDMPLGPDGQGDSESEDQEMLNKEGKDRNGRPLKVWKKKGQKRTTRKVMIRPNTAKWKPEPEWNGGKEGDDDDDDNAEEEIAIIEQTQFTAAAQVAEPDVDDADLHTDDDYVSEGVSDEDEPPDQEKMKEAKQRGTLNKVQEDTPKEKKKKMISATAHPNFRSLKIKNKNSKAKGRGRFGRRR